MKVVHLSVKHSNYVEVICLLLLGFYPSSQAPSSVRLFFVYRPSIRLSCRMGGGCLLYISPIIPHMPHYSRCIRHTAKLVPMGAMPLKDCNPLPHARVDARRIIPSPSHIALDKSPTRLVRRSVLRQQELQYTPHSPSPRSDLKTRLREL